jgi:hypothetical protein
MDRGKIPINKNLELEYRYYDRDSNYKYFNRKFEIFVLEKKTLRKNYLMHMDNADSKCFFLKNKYLKFSIEIFIV